MLALGGGLAVFILITAMTSWAVLEMEGDVRRQTLEAQQAVVERIADDLDLELSDRLRAVALVAAMYSLGNGFPDEFELGADLLRRPDLTERFHVVFAADEQGRIVYDTPHVAGRRGSSVADRPYFKEVAEKGKAVISDPFVGYTSKRPMMVFAAPVRSGGRFVGMIGAGVYLEQESFLTAPLKVGLGHTGRFMLVHSGPQPTFVAHPQGRRVMGALRDASSLAPALYHTDSAGHEGMDENGRPALLAYRTMRQVPWQLVSAYSTDEAYAALKARQIRLWNVSIAVGLACAIALWLVTQRLLAPVDALRAAMQLATEDGRAVPVPEAGSAELHALASAYNRLLQQRADSENALRERRAMLRDVTDNVPAVIALFDAQERCRFANAHAAKLVGVDPQEVLLHTFRSMAGEAIYAQQRPYLEQVLSGERVRFEGNGTFDGRDIAHQTTMLPQTDADGRVIGFYVMSFDVTPLKRAQAQLEALARFDTLTGLSNRFQFTEKLGEALARAQRSQRNVALLFLDVDHFKSINDTLGHGVGDAVLKEFARRLKACVREVDTVARLAGDEFVVILENQWGTDEAQLVARKILAKMDRPFVIDGRTISVRTSVGVAMDHLGTTAPEKLLDSADRALYSAKREGRNTFRVAKAPALAQ